MRTRRWVIPRLVLFVWVSVLDVTTAPALEAETRGPLCEPPLWRVVPTANEGAGDNELRGITALSATDAWAVGSSFDAAEGRTHPLTEHWDGATWTVVQSPPVGASGELSSVDGITPTTAWAVGSFTTSSRVGDIPHALVQRWDGTAWGIVETAAPDVGRYVSTVAKDVLALTQGDAWAVGYWSSVPDGPPSPLIEHWDGRVWEVIAGPELGSWSELYAVSGTGPDDVWAVGDTEVRVGDAVVERALIEHWDGEAWTVVKTPPVTRRHPLYPFLLEDVVALSPRDAWAVGNVAQPKRTVTLALHWDGSRWARVATVDPSRTLQMLAGVAGRSAKRMWAVGFYLDDATHQERTLVERWDGERWRAASSENMNDSSDLYDIVAVRGWRFAVGSFWSRRGDGRFRTIGLERCRG